MHLQFSQSLDWAKVRTISGKCAFNRILARYPDKPYERKEYGFRERLDFNVKY